MPSVEVRVDSGGADGVPHAFIVTTDKFGNEHGFEFAPAEHLNLWGPGKVYDDTNHEYDNSWSYEITQQQFDDLQGFIYQREHNPGVYEGWDRNCVKFVADALRSAGIDDLHSAPLTHPVELWWKQKLTPYWENVRNFFNNAQKWLLPRRDPLTLDLNNNGLETTAPNPTHPVLFDMDGDGVKNGTGWVAPTDGFLVWDKNGNGMIDSGRELFGDAFMFGGAGNDALYGGGGDDAILGGAGDDSLFGDGYYGGPGGNDTLDGGTGNDTISAGSGNRRVLAKRRKIRRDPIAVGSAASYERASCSREMRA